MMKSRSSYRTIPLPLIKERADFLNSTRREKIENMKKKKKLWPVPLSPPETVIETAKSIREKNRLHFDCLTYHRLTETTKIER